MSEDFRLREGMRVRITSGAHKTADHYGIDESMRKYFGTSQIISYIHGPCVRFEGMFEYSWHKDDLQYDEGIPEVILQGEKHQFDVNELI